MLLVRFMPVSQVVSLIPQGSTCLRLRRLIDQREDKHAHLCADLGVHKHSFNFFSFLNQKLIISLILNYYSIEMNIDLFICILVWCHALLITAAVISLLVMVGV